MKNYFIYMSGIPSVEYLLLLGRCNYILEKVKLLWVLWTLVPNSIYRLVLMKDKICGIHFKTQQYKPTKQKGCWENFKPGRIRTGRYMQAPDKKSWEQMETAGCCGTAAEGNFDRGLWLSSRFVRGFWKVEAGHCEKFQRKKRNSQEEADRRK